MPSWNWSESDSETGVVHQDTANTDHTAAGDLKQGYDYAAFSEIAPDPLACWPLHEDSGSTANDVAGSNDGSITDATLGVAGLLGTSAYSLDGSDDGVAIGSLATPPAWTLSAWVKKDSTTSSKHIWGDNGRRATLAYEIYGSDGYEVRIWDGSNAYLLTSSNTTTGEWLHLAGTFDGSTLALYINGSQVGSRSAADPAYNDSWHIGYDSGNGNHFDGDVADVRFYDQALTGSEIQTLYEVVGSTGEWAGAGKTL